MRHTLAPRDVLTMDEFLKSPFRNLFAANESFVRYWLAEAPEADDYPLLNRLKAEGYVDYCAIYASFDRRVRQSGQDPADTIDYGTGILGSFVTKSPTGFDAETLDLFQTLTPYIGVAMRALTTRDISMTLLETYLGRRSEREVFDGRIARGDGRVIDCAIWFCDLRRPSELAASLALEDYLALVNGYFGCAAGTVQDAGGEVLKFIGDAVLAIFPFDEHGADADRACAKALDAAEDALARVRRFDAQQVQIGIALHLGQVMYGNVGAPDRLDFTVIGPAVSEVTRLEALCKETGQNVLLSAAVAGRLQRATVSLGHHAVKGLESGLEAFSLADND